MTIPELVAALKESGISRLELCGVLLAFPNRNLYDNLQWSIFSCSSNFRSGVTIKNTNCKTITPTKVAKRL